MKPKWSGKSRDEAVLIKEIQSRLDSTSDGKVAFRTDFGFLIDALFERVEHSFTLDEDCLFRIFEWSVIDVLKENNTSNSEEILRRFQRKCYEVNQKKEKFTLITSVNLKNHHILKRREINGCKIAFRKNIPKKYQGERGKIILNSPENKFVEQESFLYACVTTEAPNKDTAFQNALKTIDLIRSLWHIGFNKSIYLLSSNKEKEYYTDSIIATGKLHTLHSLDGKNVLNGQWMERDYKRREAISIRNFSLTESLLSRQLKQIKKSPFQLHITKALINYINALDHEQELRFMKLWSVLEQLLLSDDSKMLIKRISFFYNNRDIEKAILESLRNARNMNAHIGIKPFNIELKNFRLCQYTEWILKVFIDNPLKCSKLSEMIEIASSPTDSKTIDEQLKKLNAIKRYIK